MNNAHTTPGHCLCGRVSFAILGPLPGIYHCHCSKCRRVSGAASNAALLVAQDSFRWRGGEEGISRYATPSGFRSDFCGHCGSPLPNPTRDGRRYWVPAGLLDEPARSRAVARVYVDSRASWDCADETTPAFAEMPDAQTLDDLVAPQQDWHSDRDMG